MPPIRTLPEIQTTYRARHPWYRFKRMECRMFPGDVVKYGGQASRAATARRSGIRINAVAAAAGPEHAIARYDGIVSALGLPQTTWNTDVPVKILYIMGFGRSGSTLLDTVLSDRDGTFGAGELCNLLSAMDVWHSYCACGRRSAECPLWTAIRREWSHVAKADVAAEYPALQRRIERIRTYLRHQDRFLNDPSTARYLKLTGALFEAVANVTGATTLVDSSKRPVRALALSRTSGIDLRVIHLVRDVRGAAHSISQRFESDPRGGIMNAMSGKNAARTAVAWALTNTIANRVRERLGSRATLVRYEDFVTRPAETLQHLSTFTGVDFSPTAQKLQNGGAFKAGHTIEGNRLRMHDRIELRPDTRWRKEMSKVKKSALPLITAPVSWRYGYLPWR